MCCALYDSVVVSQFIDPFAEVFGRVASSVIRGRAGSLTRGESSLVRLMMMVMMMVMRRMMMCNVCPVDPL